MPFTSKNSASRSQREAGAEAASGVHVVDDRQDGRAAAGAPDVAEQRRSNRDRRALPPTQRNAPARLVEGATVHGWKQALGQLALHFPDRLDPHLN